MWVSGLDRVSLPVMRMLSSLTALVPPPELLLDAMVDSAGTVLVVACRLSPVAAQLCFALATTRDRAK